MEELSNTFPKEMMNYRHFVEDSQGDRWQGEENVQL